MQKLLGVVQEFTEWCGMKINVEKTFLLLVGKDQKRREDAQAPKLWINGKRFNTKIEGQVCRYLGYWGTGDGDMMAAKVLVCKKAAEARDLIKGHPLTP